MRRIAGADMARDNPTTTQAHRLQYLGLSLLSGAFSVLSHRPAVHAGDALGRLAGRVAPLRRRVAEENLRLAFPELSEAARRRVLRGLYRHLGRSLAEFSRYPVMDSKWLSRWVKVEGEDHLREAMAAGRGVFMVTSHYGNWELLGPGLAARGFPITLMVGPQHNKLAEEMFNRYRGFNGVQVLVTTTDMRGVFRALEAGRVVASAADQDDGPGGFFLDFLGRPASAAVGPYRIARRVGSPVVVALVERRGMSHRILIDPPVRSDPALGAREEAESWARHFHARLEEAIRRHPEQWFWVHRRWHNRPPEERRAD
jgi:Kdo2-lipid IVA lauroyltransferase/acyltransferase